MVVNKKTPQRRFVFADIVYIEYSNKIRSNDEYAASPRNRRTCDDNQGTSAGKIFLIYFQQIQN